MLTGLFTNSLPGPLSAEKEGEASGSVAYAALLTAKGRMITDLRIFRDPDEGFVLELPEVGTEPALAHFRKFLPPRLAQVVDRSEELARLTLLGPDIPGLLAKAGSGMGWTGSVESIVGLIEGEESLFRGSGGALFRVSRNGDVPNDGWDLLLPAPAVLELLDRLMALGALPLTEASRETLRIERGRPSFGKDMDADTIPLEAGIQRRAIDDRKGCYAGQEVVIRIRDRGHVNKELRGLLLGDVPVPSYGQELFLRGSGKAVGRVTSAVASPAFAQTIALGYLQWSIPPGDVVRLGAEDGPEAQVRALGDEGWILD
jgi:aminomethyltransferase